MLDFLDINLPTGLITKKQIHTLDGYATRGNYLGPYLVTKVIIAFMEIRFSIQN